MQTELYVTGSKQYLVTTGEVASELGDRPILAVRELDIMTHYWAKPDPCRDFDWSAIDDRTFDGAPDAGGAAHRVGYGATEQEAIEDLISQLTEEQEEVAQ